MNRKPISRRTMLRGLGTAAVGLPFLEEMLVSSATAAKAAEVPVRAFNVFFGLGIPSPLQAEGFKDVFEPLILCVLAMVCAYFPGPLKVF